MEALRTGETMWEDCSEKEQAGRKEWSKCRR
jgi:hypothetical protein